MHRRSSTFELRRHTALFVPAGFAHGYQTLVDDVLVEYLMSERHAPELADGFRPDDPAAAIAWPLPPVMVSKRDLTWPDLEEREFCAFANRRAAEP